MKTRTEVIALAAATLALAGISRAEDSFAGKWKGEFDSQIGVQKYTFDLIVNGDKITGKAIGERSMGTNEVVLTEGKVSTNEIFFVEPLKFDDNELRIEYKGKLTDKGLQLHRKVGDFAEEDFLATRVKETETKSEAKPESKPDTKPAAKPEDKRSPARP